MHFQVVKMWKFLLAWEPWLADFYTILHTLKLNLQLDDKNFANMYLASRWVENKHYEVLTNVVSRKYCTDVGWQPGKTASELLDVQQQHGVGVIGPNLRIFIDRSSRLFSQEFFSVNISRIEPENVMAGQKIEIFGVHAFFHV